MSQAIDRVNLGLALGEPLMHLKQLIPLLERRYAYAKEWMLTKDAGLKDQNEDAIKYINEQIKNVLGL